MPLPLAFVKINLKNLIHNYHSIREIAKTELICVSKADSYGHGASICVPALYNAGARFFAVANIVEALDLREYLRGTEDADPADIIILGSTMPADAPELIGYNLIQTIYSREYAEAFSQKIPAGKRVRAHIKIDTGMNRLGFDCTESGLDGIAAVCADNRFTCEGFYSHFACSDESDSRGLEITGVQLARYKAAESALARRGITFSARHISNSAGALYHPEAALNYTRAGIVLYGLNPSGETTPPVTLRPVMDFYTTVTHVHTLRAGESVSYGSAFTAEREIRAATLAVGYADGYLRAYGGATARIRGVDCPIIGRICMDQCVCDAGSVPGITPGDEALLFGEGKPVEELARLAGTINYECVCLIGKRIPRITVN